MIRSPGAVIPSLSRDLGFVPPAGRGQNIQLSISNVQVNGPRYFWPADIVQPRRFDSGAVRLRST
jgi:hypothetical protein